MLFSFFIKDQAIEKDTNPEIIKMFSLIVKFKELLKKMVMQIS